MKQTPRIVFVGVHSEAAAPFRFLAESQEAVTGLVTLTAEAATRVSGAVDLTPIAERAGVPVYKTANVNNTECVRWIAGRKPDIVLVIGWTQLLKEPLLRIPTVAALGFHASLLPKYRGRAPVNWAIINGETETGNTMIVLAPGADEGEIVAQRRIPIGLSDTCATIYDRVGETEVDMLREVLPLIREGRMPRRLQDASAATVMPKRRPEDGKIDWTKTSRQLHDWVRALTHPYPGAFTFFEAGGQARRIWIWRAAAVPAAAEWLPGTLTHDEAGWPVVTTRDGGLRLLSVQVDGAAETDGNLVWSAGLRSGMRFEEAVS